MEVHFDKHHHTKRTKPFKSPGMNEFYDHFKDTLPGEMHNQIDNEVEIADLHNKVHKNNTDLARIEHLLNNINWYELSNEKVAVLRAAQEQKQKDKLNHHEEIKKSRKKYA